MGCLGYDCVVAQTNPFPAVSNTVTAMVQSVTTAEDTPVVITLMGSSVDGDVLTFTIVTEPTHGTLSGIPPVVTYTPTTDFNGTDSFTFRVSGQMLSSSPSTVSLTITPVYDPPTATSAHIVVYEDAMSSGVTPVVADADIATNGDIHTFVIVSSPVHGVTSVVTDTQGQVRIAWDTVRHPHLAGYRLYYGLSSQTYAFTIDVGNEVTYVLTGLDQGQTYYFAVIAYDTAGDESLFSQELTYQVPRVGQFVYTPQPHFHGSDSFTYLAIDTEGASVLGTADVLVLPVNHAPVAIDDTVETMEDMALTMGNVLANDTDVDGDPLRVSNVTPAAHGVVAVNSDGTFTYVPEPNFNGVDSFTYTVSDDHGGTAIGTVHITVRPVDDAPEAPDVVVVTSVGVAMDVAVPMTDVDGDALLVVSVTSGAHGTVVPTDNGTVHYTPNPDFWGQDSFIYTVRNGHSGTATGTITVTVAHAPVAANDTAETAEDTTVTIGNVLANDTNADGGGLWVSDYTPAAHGIVRYNGDGTFTYTPEADFNGLDSFIYTVTNSVGLSATATVTVRVTAVNDAPVAEDLSVTTSSNTAVPIMLNGHDVDSDLLVFAIATGPGWGSLSGSPRSLTYTPQAHFVGIDSFTYIVTDTEGLTSTATVTITVTGLVAAYSFDEGQGTMVADASGHANHGTIAGAIWTPQGRFGSALAFDGVSNWVTVEEARSLALTTSLTLEAWVYPTGPMKGWRTVLMKEQPNGYAYYLGTNSEANIPVTGVFIEGEQSLFGGEGLPTHTWTHLAATYDGTTQRLYVNGVEVASQPQTGQVPVSSAALRIGGNSVWGEYFQGKIDEVRLYNRALTVSEIQRDLHSPVAPPNTMTVEENGTTDLVVLPNGMAMDGSMPTVVSVSQGTNGTVVIMANGTVRYTPNLHFHGQDSFTYTMSDTNGETATTVVHVTVTAVHNTPVAFAQSMTTVEDTPVAITLQGSDMDGDVLTFVIVTEPVNGTVSSMPPVVTYTPTARFVGTDSFTFRVSDGALSSSSATVNIIVTPARLVNGGFESGDFTGWLTIGETRIETAAFGSGPADGRFQAFLSTAGPVENPGDPEGAAVPVSALETFLELPVGSLHDLSTDVIIEGSAIRQTFMANAGDVVSFDWNFLTNESTNLHELDAPANPELNDHAFVTIVTPSLLADTAFWSFSLSQTVLSGETGFRRFSFPIPATGMYMLSIGVVDVGDGGGLSGLLIDNVSLTPVNP
jgi:hypothetical protein